MPIAEGGILSNPSFASVVMDPGLAFGARDDGGNQLEKDPACP